MSSESETSKASGPNSGSETLLTAEILLLLWTVPPCVRALGFFRTARLFKRLASRLGCTRLARLSDADPDVFSRRVEALTAHPLARPTQCTTHSIALQFVLEQHGHPAEIRLGVQNLLGGLRAHAWVETSGIELATNPRSGQYVPFMNA